MPLGHAGKIMATVFTDDPGSNPDQKYAWRRERQITFGRTKQNLGLRAKEIRFVYDILVHCEGVDFKVTGTKFMTVFVMRKDVACS